MAKEDLIELDGTVTDCLPNAMFKVNVSDKHSVLAVISGKIRQNKIKIALGDSVKLELSPYDLTRGRIVRRHK